MGRIKVTEKLFEASKKKYEEILDLHETQKDIDWVLDVYDSTAGTKWRISEGVLEPKCDVFVRVRCERVFQGSYKTFLYEFCDRTLSFDCRVHGELVIHKEEK